MAHKHEDIFENRKEFQLERMILFSDAVFAIAITLLVLDLKLPEAKLYNSYAENADAAMEAMGSVALRFLGFICSFFIIGQYWVTHHRLFGFITDFDGGLIWLNLLTLFWIVLVPFTTSLNFNFGSVATWVIYTINLAMVSLSVLLMWRRISNPKLHLTWLLNDPLRLKYGMIRSLVVTIIFLSGLICLIPGMLHPAQFMFILIFPAMRIVGYRYKKALRKQEAWQASHPEPKHHK